MSGEPEHGKPRAAGADLVIPALALAFALYFFTSIVGLNWEAKANGVVIGTVLLVLIALQFGRVALQVARGEATLGLDPLLQPRDVALRRLALIVIMVLFVATIGWLGTILGIILAMVSAMLVLGVRQPGWLIGMPLVVAVLLHLMFVTFLGAKLPAGLVEGLLALLGGST